MAFLENLKKGLKKVGRGVLKTGKIVGGGIKKALTSKVGATVVVVGLCIGWAALTLTFPIPMIVTTVALLGGNYIAAHIYDSYTSHKKETAVRKDLKERSQNQDYFPDLKRNQNPVNLNNIGNESALSNSSRITPPASPSRPALHSTPPVKPINSPPQHTSRS